MRNRINMPNKKQEVDSMRSIDPQPTYAIKDNIMDTPDKQDNYRSYFLRMYLYIAHICKMVKTLMIMNAMVLKSFTPSTVYGARPVLIVLKITLCNIIILPKNKAQVPKNRPSNFNCFSINSLFIMDECKLFFTSVTKPVLTGWNRASEGSIGHIKILAELGCLDAD